MHCENIQIIPILKIMPWSRLDQAHNEKKVELKQLLRGAILKNYAFLDGGAVSTSAP